MFLLMKVISRQKAIKGFLFPLLLCLFPVFYPCCGFIDLRPIGINTIPEGPWGLLPNAESPVIVGFDTDMDKKTVEKALQIFSPWGVADGELRWYGRELKFFPAAPWLPGIRYALRLSGTVSAEDGRELLLSREIPFFAVSRAVLPYVKSFSPGDGASVSVSSPAVLELKFSVSMDRPSSEAALKLDIPGTKVLDWLDDDRTLIVRSDSFLNPWTVYKWSLSDKALSREGSPLAKEFSGRFVSDLDREFISVVRLVPLIPPEPFSGFIAEEKETGSGNEPWLWGSWIPAGLGLEQGLGSGHGIGIELSKAADEDSLRRAFGFVPALPGRVEILSPVSAVYIPSKDPEPETVYSLRISGALKDLSGLRMGEDYAEWFSADIPYLKILSLTSDENDAGDEPKPGIVFPVQVNAGGTIRLFFHFSPLFDTLNPSVREECAFKISLRPFFPAVLPPLSLRTALWLTAEKLLMEWDGSEGGLPGENHFYKLIIPGGPAGIQNGKGSYLKEDLALYLEAKL